MSNENTLSTTGQGSQAKQPWIAPAIEVLDLNTARHGKHFTLKDNKFKS